MSRELARGYVPRDFKEVPLFSVYKEYSGPRHHPNQWDELIKYHKANKSGPFEVWKAQETRLKSQGSWPYCWAYGTIMAMQLAYQMSGMKPYPDLQPFSTAWLIKGGRKRGGFGVEACRGIEKYGVAEMNKWPRKQRYSYQGELKQNMERHKLVEFEELDPNDFEGRVSAMLDPDDPCACSAAYNHMRHLMCGAGIEEKTHAIVDINSWGQHRNSDRVPKGCYRLTGRKRIAFEVVVIRRVKHRTEA